MTKTIRRRLAAAIAVLSMASEAAAVQMPDVSAMEQFEQRVNAYAALRRAVAARTPPPMVSSDSGAILAAADALAEAIRAARPQARAGDMFTTHSASAFRRRIEGVLKRNHRDLADLLTAIDREAPPPAAPLTVNDRFDWQYGALMPGDLIEALPPLPGFLQYRFVGRDLLLIDIEADLIIDILPTLWPLTPGVA